MMTKQIRKDDQFIISLPKEDITKALELLSMRFDERIMHYEMTFFVVEEDYFTCLDSKICANNITKSEHSEANALLWGFYFGKRLSEIHQVKIEEK